VRADEAADGDVLDADLLPAGFFGLLAVGVIRVAVPVGRELVDLHAGQRVARLIV
jgi:hypothetical protein